MADPKWAPAESKGPGTMQIGGSFGSRTVAKGVKVKYSLSGYGLTRDRISNTDGPNVRIQWVVTYHYGRDDAKEPVRWQKKKDDAGNRSSATEFVFEWDRVGHHRVHCLTWSFDGTPHAKMEFDQRVDELWAILESEWEKRKKDKLPHPVLELKTVKKYRDLLVNMGMLQGAAMDRDTRAKHNARVAELSKYADKLEALLARCDQSFILPFKAVYLAKDSMEFGDLRVFLSHAKGNPNELMVIDWTNVEEPKLHGTYSGYVPAFEPYDGAGAGSRAPTPQPSVDNEGQRWQEGVRNALKRWESKNNYWPGGVEYLVRARHARSGYSIEVNATFKTGDPSAAESLAAWMKKIAFGAAMIALVLTGIGSTYAGALIVTSMVAGTTGAVLSIHHRRATGQDNFLADATDVLDIVANVFGAGYRAGAAVMWRAGRTVAIESAGQKALKALFIGQTWANGFNGILLGVTFVDRYNKIMAMTGVAPDERAQMLLDLFKEASLAGGLHVVNQKIASAAERANFQKLLEQDAIPRPINDNPSGGSGGSGGKTPPGAGSGGKGTSDGVPRHVDDQESGFHVVPSDGVPKKIDDNPVSGKAPTVPVKTPAKTNDPDKTAPIKVTDKPGFPGKTQEREKKVTVVTRQNKQTTPGVKPQPSTGSNTTPSGKYKNGIPPDIFQDGRYLVLGLWNKEPRPWDWLKDIKAKDATTVKAYDDPPIYKAPSGRRIPDDNPDPVFAKRGFYPNAAEISKGVIRGANLHEKRAILFDLTGMDTGKALTRGAGADAGKIYDAVTSHELRYIRDNWNTFSPAPRFFRDGQEVSRPW